MKRLTRKNYQAYALDYLEGTLATKHRARFEQFLDKHPDLRQEVAELQEEFPVVPADLRIAYPDKSVLRRSVLRVSRGWLFYGSLAAACVALALTFGTIFYNAPVAPDSISVLEPVASIIEPAVEDTLAAEPQQQARVRKVRRPAPVRRMDCQPVGIQANTTLEAPESKIDVTKVKSQHEQGDFVQMPQIAQDISSEQAELAKNCLEKGAQGLTTVFTSPVKQLARSFKQQPE